MKPESKHKQTWKQMNEKTKVTVILDTLQLSLIERLAQEQRKTVSDIIRELAESFIEHNL